MNGRILILDGGLGTTLEDVFHHDISTPLWSAKPIDDDPEVIISAHLAFLRSGADIILTSTYQCAYKTFEQAGISRDDARRIMLRSIKLAVDAKRRFREEQVVHMGPSDPSLLRDVKIALSLGPYGATLTPAQEFNGFYPPPFGPDFPCSSDRINNFEDTDDGHVMERAAIDVLTSFHYDRLSVFADDKETWDALDFVAFETIPLRREIIAVRRAVTELQRNKDTRMKPWWISTVHPDGRYPEIKPDGERVAAVDVANAVLLAAEEEAVPLGFGINCTDVKFLPRLLGDIHDVARRSREMHGMKPWLVLYPNRGDVYDTQTRTWQTNGREGSQWAEDLCAIVLEEDRQSVWEGIIVGGCCKTGPKEIAGLSSNCKVLPW